MKNVYLHGELCGVDDAGLPSLARTQAATDALLGPVEACLSQELRTAVVERAAMRKPSSPAGGFLESVVELVQADRLPAGTT